MQVEYEHAVQQRLAVKYGAAYGITPALLTRIENNEATPAELQSYTENAPGLTAQFLSDLRSLDMSHITTIDAEIIVGLLASNNDLFDRDETLTKLLTPDGVKKQLASGLPTLQGFSAMSRFSRDLSPQQTIQQFGASHEYQGETPFLVDVDGALELQTFVYSIESPITGKLREIAKVPVDPRLLAAMLEIANDPARGPDDVMKRAAQEVANPAVCCVVPLDDSPETRALVEGFVKAGFAVAKPLNRPTTDNATGDVATGYISTIQERTLGDSPVPCPEGTAIYIAVPGPGAPAGPNLPAGSFRLKLFEWTGGKWEPTPTDWVFEGAVPLPKAFVDSMKKLLVKVTDLNAAHAAGLAKDGLDTPLPEVVKKMIGQKERDAKRKVLTDLTGDVLVATAAIKLKKKPEAEAKRKAKKRKEEEDEEKEAAAKREEQKAKEQEEQEQKQAKQQSEKASQTAQNESAD